MASTSSVEITRRLKAIRRRYPEVEELASDVRGNYQNANREVVNALERMDSEIRDAFIEDAYGEVRSFHDLAQIDYLDPDITEYGDLLVLIRFCDGYIGNLAQGQRLTKNQCAALMFGYECYWREGEDFLLGIVVENHLRRIPAPEEWGWPADNAFEGKEENWQIQWLGYTIAKEMKEIARYHRLKQPGFDNFRTSTSVKPAFRDFRAILNQIEAAAKAERSQRRSSGAKQKAGHPEEVYIASPEDREMVRGALAEYISDLDHSRQIKLRKLMGDDSFAQQAESMVALTSMAIAATVKEDEFRKQVGPLRPATAAKRHPEIKAIARYYVVENGAEVFNMIVGNLGLDGALERQALARFNELQKMVSDA